MKTSVVAAWVIAAGALGAPACGSNGSDRCGEVQPCGGDVVGTWTWSRACPSAAAYTAQANGSCRGSVVNSISQDVGGTLTFNADLTFHFENATNTLATNNSFPIDCQAVATCAALDRHEANTTQSIDTTCTGTTTCTCDSRVSTFGQTVTGTYSTAGTALTMVLGTVATTGGYCVEGNRLHQITLGTNQSTNGQILVDSVAQLLSR